MQIHESHDKFDLTQLINRLLLHRWQHECVIISDYMPPYPKEDTRPKCVVKYVNEDGVEYFLRHSKGPGTGTFWDVYGDNFLTMELALVELSKAHPPHNVKVGLSATHGNAYAKWDAQ